MDPINDQINRNKEFMVYESKLINDLIESDNKFIKALSKYTKLLVLLVSIISFMAGLIIGTIIGM